MKKRILTMLVACLALVGAVQAQSPKRELRSSWLATVWALDWPKSTNQATAKAQLIDYLDNFAAHNFNGVCFQVRGLADAMYKSSYEPWNSALTGTRGKDPGWDPLAFAIEECHKRGLECYAWVNPYRESSTANPYSTAQDQKWLADGWLLSNGSYIVFNPGMPETRAHILNVIKEIYTNYAIDGMLFDDYFYPSGGTSEGTNAPDYDLYKASGTTLSIGDWRRKNVNDFMKEIYDNIQHDRPDLRFGISPAGVAGASASKYGLSKPSGVTASDWQYAEIYSDPLAWLSDGSVDFISPQIYWKTNHSTAPFGPLTKWWSQVSEHFGRHFYASHSISMLLDNNTTANWKDLCEQVSLHRQYNTQADPGEIYYSAKNLDGAGSASGASGFGNYLLQNRYQAPALVPRITWKDRHVYAAPAGFKRSGSTLSWTATKGERTNSVIRYSVYAIPMSVAIENAMDATGDGIDGKYLAGVSYATSYAIPAGKTSGYYYAVCVYDGYGYESEPAIVGYSTIPSEKTSLVAPADGSTVDWTATFSWNAVADATYSVEISSKADFSVIDLSRDGITTTKATIDLSTLRSTTTYYWRVVVAQPDKLGSASDAFTFITPKREVGNYEQGYSVATDGATYADADDYKLTSLWYRSADKGNFNVVEDGKLNRGMVATPDYVYVSGRSEASSSADLYLQAYNAETGEHEHDVILSSNGQCSYFPCNDVIKDSNGNVCITNLTLNISNTPLNVHLVNVTTGNLTEVASLTASESGRIDHAGIFGDVTTGNFTVFAAVASSNVIFRWTITNGEASAAEKRTVSAFYPSNAANFGIAPRVLPVSSTLLYVDGGSTSAALYDFSTGKIVDKSVPEASSKSSNGVATFNFDGKDFMLYAASSFESGFTFNLTAAGSDKTFAAGSRLWNFPESTLGDLNSTTYSAPVSALVNNADRATVYVYAPGNGLAAYALTKKTQGVSDVVSEMPSYHIYGRTIVFDAPVAFAKAFTLSGVEVASVASSVELQLPTAGIYLVVTPSGAAKIAIHGEY